jgi:hypothetical protein
VTGVQTCALPIYEYALKVQPAAKSLGLVIRKAVWMGKGRVPHRDEEQPIIEIEAVPVPALPEATPQIPIDTTPIVIEPPKLPHLDASAHDPASDPSPSDPSPSDPLPRELEIQPVRSMDGNTPPVPPASPQPPAPRSSVPIDEQ